MATRARCRLEPAKVRSWCWLSHQPDGSGSSPEKNLASHPAGQAGKKQLATHWRTGLILAAHASVGIQAVREREAFEQLGRQLHEALSSRDVIGQAKGILMERLRITPEDAFDTLRRASQRLNIKLRDIAERLAHSGSLDGPGGN